MHQMFYFEWYCNVIIIAYIIQIYANFTRSQQNIYFTYFFQNPKIRMHFFLKTMKNRENGSGNIIRDFSRI